MYSPSSVFALYLFVIRQAAYTFAPARIATPTRILDLALTFAKNVKRFKMRKIQYKADVSVIKIT